MIDERGLVKIFRRVQNVPISIVCVNVFEDLSFRNRVDILVDSRYVIGVIDCQCVAFSVLNTESQTYIFLLLKEYLCRPFGEKCSITPSLSRFTYFEPFTFVVFEPSR